MDYVNLKVAASIFILTLSFSLSNANSTDAFTDDFVQVKDTITIAPANFTWNQLEDLRDGKIIQTELEGELKGHIVKMRLTNTADLKSAWPSAWQVISQNNFLSRILKTQEIQCDSQKPEIKIQTLSTYRIQSNYSFGSTYCFNLISELDGNTSNKTAEIDLNSSQNMPPELLSSIINGERYTDIKIRGIHYGARALLNVFQFPFGETYPASRLRSNLHSHILTNWSESTSKYSLGYDEVPMYSYKSDNNGNYVIVSSPVHDLNENANFMEQVSSGNLAINSVVKEIAENPTFNLSDLKLLMPVAQSNNGRRHWTLLALEKKNSIWSASHFDSKGISSSYYSLENVINGLAGIKCNQIDLFYLGHQGLMNLKDCPRYVISYIHNIIQNRDPQNLTNKQVEAIFPVLSY